MRVQHTERVVQTSVSTVNVVNDSLLWRERKFFSRFGDVTVLSLARIIPVRRTRAKGERRWTARIKKRFKQNKKTERASVSDCG